MSNNDLVNKDTKRVLRFIRSTFLVLFDKLILLSVCVYISENAYFFLVFNETLSLVFDIAKLYCGE